jgi:radical SAM protein with 4Fe4S-binding SPASM domain
MDNKSISSKFQLKSCIWELTLKCTMNCIHCGSSAGKARIEELSLAECIPIADELVKIGCRELTFIGGEIFLYKGWEEIARFLSEKGILVNLMTNGYKVGETEISHIKRGQLINVGVSIDGMEKNHNLIRGKKDSFARIKRTLDLLNQERIPIAVVTSLLDFNYYDLDELYGFLIENGVQLWQLQLVNAMGNMANKKELIIKSEKIPPLIEFIREKNKDSHMVILAADSIGYYNDDEAFIRGNRAPLCYWEGCQAGISAICIDSTGNIKGCGALYSNKFIEGNLRERSLTDIWNDPNCFSYNRRFSPKLLSGKCKDCTMGDVCQGGCRASNYFMTGSLYENMFCARHKTRHNPKSRFVN